MTQENPSGRPDKKRRGPQKSERRRVCEEAGLSRHQIYQMMAIGEIPEEDFERLVESDKPPTIEALARYARNLPKRRPRKVQPEVCPHCGGSLAGIKPGDAATELES